MFCFVCPTFTKTNFIFYILTSNADPGEGGGGVGGWIGWLATPLRRSQNHQNCQIWGQTSDNILLKTGSLYNAIQGI